MHRCTLREAALTGVYIRVRFIFNQMVAGVATKPVGKGTGLGLSISYQIVTEKHHGRLYCNTTPGQGTKFVIEIPIRQFSHAAA
ncbi:sensor histidine kinase [Fischerella thermalis CCMEE 5273]|uniref:histidine kinase n=2 Tax=Fischerella TaxID=1190 RepID=G6FUC5_9CYAN|nr:ATP-binding region ATPase domain protein [Fischerella thermalis JSC-11]PLZ09775.1 sensor histidine kinase [Fischerella thermalis WC114]PLZ10810.1 sensor histidine kinase [Fischerella thermalis WC119]PLZ19383.1 sensor histidine kinase [Fischerella thermalis WC157]PLZ22107.1 sensor histidine kinase [Fischerella thermalis WC341]PLZ29507.1 sensor histidine kinase [Fischerella thermalis WC559]PLZ31051.1 sensor histidine kinase [Fischerella thermalis WC558]PLZ34589.1 sensor histidine kinase [Fi